MRSLMDHTSESRAGGVHTATVQTGQLQLVCFPEEFRKSFWQGVDRRIAIIFTVNFLAIYGGLVLASLQPTKPASNQMDVRLLRKITAALKVTAPWLESVDENTVIESFSADRSVRALSPVPPIQKRVSVDRARLLAANRFRAVSEKVSQHGLLASTTKRRTEKYSDDDFAARGIQFRDVSAGHGPEEDVMDVAKSGLRVSMPHANEVQSIEDLARIGGGEEMVSVKAAISGQGLIGVGRTRYTGGNLSDATSVTDIQRVVDQHAGAIMSCYQKQLKRQPDLEGKLTAQIRVNASGQVHGVRLQHNTVGAEVGGCVQRKIRGWKFPVRSKGSFTIHQTFVFAR